MLFYLKREKCENKQVNHYQPNDDAESSHDTHNVPFMAFKRIFYQGERLYQPMYPLIVPFVGFQQSREYS
jgi:hypothetical protein